MPNEGGVDVTGFIASYMDAGGKDVEGALKYVTDYNEATQRPDVGGEIDEKVSAKQASVDNLVKKLGITEEQAWRITEGVIKVVQDPDTGNIDLLDISTGIATRAKTPSTPDGQVPISEDVPTDEGESLYSMALGSTGVGSSAKALLQRGAEQVGIEVPGAPEVVDARQQVAAAQQQLVRS